VEILFNFSSGQSQAASPLLDPLISGFLATLSGVSYQHLNWDFNGFAVLFWSSTPAGQEKALSHGLNQENHSVSDYPASRNNAFPVRCIKD
jgi:uncharacterized protein (TIGR02145 family)